MTRATTDHERWMARAIELAGLGEGKTRPNPPVGAVIVKSGKIVGEGHHRRAGGAHAEKSALAVAATEAKGATLYVTLEPCCTWGRTGPCTEAILQAGIRRVVVASRDPNPAHAGKGIRQLRRHGIEVVEGIQREPARELIRPFEKWIRTGKPYLTLKLGMTIDGKIADARSNSRWITGPAAREKVQGMRRRADVVLVGANTVVEDNPRLLPRPARGRKPFRVVVDSSGRIPLSANVLSDRYVAQTIVAVTAKCPTRKQSAIQRKGAEVLLLPSRGGRVSLDALFRELGTRGLLHVFCEGGGQLAEGLVRRELVDEYALFYAPSILGAGGNIPGIGGPGWKIDARPHLHFLSHESVGSDILVRAVPADGFQNEKRGRR